MLDEILKVFKLSGLLDSIRGYIDAKVKLYVADLENKVARVMTGVILMVTFMIIFLIMIIFAGVGLSLVINRWLESYFLGFFIVGGSFFILMIIIGSNIKSGFLHRVIKSVIFELLNKKE